MSKEEGIIPKQPEVNIGTAGHVDHGKCLSLDEAVITFDGVKSGYDLLEYSKYGKVRYISENEWIVHGIRVPVLSLKRGGLRMSYGFIFFQEYDGDLMEIETDSGSEIRVTPTHPLLKLDREYRWEPASKLKVGDLIAIANLSRYTGSYTTPIDPTSASTIMHLIENRGSISTLNILLPHISMFPNRLRNAIIKKILFRNGALRSDFEELTKKEAYVISYLLRLLGLKHEIIGGKGPPKIICYGDNYDSDLINDKVRSIRRRRYDGLIYDLYVPRYHNFVAGLGGILAHNTTIIQALTGIWTSSHSEELRRGITIKIGYADMPIYELCKGDDKIYWSSPEYPGYSDPKLVKVISFVDCPGHESLMANMLSGAAVMDGALLVIAANEPVPRPQTKEHAMALEILGVRNIVVVQNKVDLVTKEEALENYKEIRDFLATTKYYSDAPIIPISAVQKVNLQYLVGSIVKHIPTPERELDKPPRMLVIRSFNINLPGTDYKKLRGGVIGGSIIQGKIKVGDEIEIVPGHMTRKGDRIVHEPLYSEVKSLSSQKLRLEEAYSGGLIGIQTDLDPSLTKADGMVGNVAGKPGTLPEVFYEVTMDISLFEYVVGTDEKLEVQPLSKGEPIRVNIGSSVALGYIIGLGKDWADIKLIRPVAAEGGWRAAIAREFNGKWRLIGVGEVR